MSTDMFEDTLRDLLRDTADAEGPAYRDIDSHVVLADGRRVVRHRRVTAGLGLAAASVAAGLVGVSAFGGGSSQTSVAAASPSGASWSRTMSVDLSLAGSVTTEPTKVAVGVAPSQNRWTHSLVRPQDTTTDGDTGTITVTIDSHELPSAPGQTSWVMAPGSPGLAVGVLPQGAAGVSFIWADRSARHDEDLAALPGSPYRAFAALHVATDGKDPALLGLLWTDRTRVFDDRGAEVRSVRTGQVLSFIDRRLGVFGIYDGTFATQDLSDVPAGSVPTILTGTEVKDTDTMVTRALFVLPAGAREVSVTASGAAALVASETFGDGATGDTLVTAELIGPFTKGQDLAASVSRVTWTNADGSAGSADVGE